MLRNVRREGGRKLSLQTIKKGERGVKTVKMSIT